ncbi:MAG: glycosyltransferase family 2 protein [Candidatus Hodarchaeota archaeon]
MLYNQPLISIILPTYNRSHVLTRAIRSILNQTYQNFKLLIVDDGSCDNTKQVVEGFSDSRIRYLRRERNEGGSVARNSGIEAAKGEYIAFQDSDDIWLPQKLEMQMRVFETSSLRVGVVYCEWLYSREGKIFYHRYFKKRTREGNLCKTLDNYDFFIPIPAVIVRKNCLEKTGFFDVRFSAQEDFDLLIRLSKFYHFKYVRTHLLIQHRPLSYKIDKRTLPSIKTNFLLLEKHSNLLKRKRGFMSNHYYLIGKYLFFKKKERHQWQSYFRYVVKINPLDFFSVKLFILIFIGFFIGSNRILWSYKTFSKKITNSLLLWLLRG